MYIAAGQSPRGQNFDVNRNFLSLRSFATSFKTILLKSDFIHFFHDFIHVYSLRQGQSAPRGQNFDVNKNILSLRSFVASYKKSLRCLIL